jgi:hypothetical protein
MFKKTDSRLLAAVVFMFVFVGVAAAHEVRISNVAKVGNNSELQPGTYRVEVVKNQGSSEVLFYEGSDLRLRAPVTLEPESEKSQLTEVHYSDLDGGKVITQIRIRGWKERLVFNHTPAANPE